MFVRNVGHLMTTPVIKLPDGGEAPEGLLRRGDHQLSSRSTTCKGLGRYRNSRAGSIYIVKPKQARARGMRLHRPAVRRGRGSARVSRATR